MERIFCRRDDEGHFMVEDLILNNVAGTLRVTLTDTRTGSIAFNGTLDLFNKCVEKDIFVEKDLSADIVLSLWPDDRNPIWRNTTITCRPRLKGLMIRILAEVNMTKVNYQKLADILAESTK